MATSLWNAPQPTPLTAGQPTTPTAPKQPLSPSPGVSLTPTNPANDLRGQTIGVGPTANRVDLANQYIQNWNTQSEPQFQSDLRSATSNAAGMGQLGSGQLRSALGNVVQNRDTQRNTAESNFLTNALQGSIGDAYNNVGIAQQQQQYQTGLQNQTFNQALQQYQVGATGDPSSTQLGLSGIYANNANQAGSSLTGLIGNTTANQSSQGLLQQLLNQYGITPPGSSTTVPGQTPPYSSAIPTGAYGY